MSNTLGIKNDVPNYKDDIATFACLKDDGTLGEMYCSKSDLEKDSWFKELVDETANCAEYAAKYVARGEEDILQPIRLKIAKIMFKDQLSILKRYAKKHNLPLSEDETEMNLLLKERDEEQNAEVK